MHYKTNRVISVAVPKPIDTLFDYEVPKEMAIPAPGTRLKVPFGNSESIGLCLGRSEQLTHKTLKPILESIDQQPLISKSELEIGKWLSNYYHYPIGEALFTIIPSDIRRGKSLALDDPDHWVIASDKRPPKKAYKQIVLYDFIQDSQGANYQTILDAGFSSNTLRTLKRNELIKPVEPPVKKELNNSGLKLNDEQQLALKKFQSGQNSYNCYLLEGITGSGKTEVYLQAMKSIIDMGKEVLVLVPEISLTPQTFERFSSRFPQTGLIHSGLTNHNVLQTWIKCKTGALSCLVGTRSAVFAPFQNLGLIIVDEEHDSSYKQQEGLKYSARDVAVKRANQMNIPVILGTATPSIESINNVERGKYSLLSLNKRANDSALPVHRIIDISNQQLIDGFSPQTISTIQKHLAKNNQAMIFINKRGFSRTLFCTNCGWHANCVRCEARTTKHVNPDRMICHYCGWQEKVKNECPECRKEKLIALGLGTQKLESTLHKLFPDFPVYRIDRDSTRNTNQFAEVMEKINSGAPCILVGTQMLSKGHHFKNLTLVVVMEADTGFNSIDFRGPEKTAQQIIQVSGRAGRDNQQGEIILQTYQSANPQLTDLVENGYRILAQNELKIRKKMKFPPFRSMAIIRAEASIPALAENLLRNFNLLLADYETLGPAPAIVRKISNRYRYQLMILTDNNLRLNNAFSIIKDYASKNHQRKVKWSIDIDPIEI